MPLTRHGMYHNTLGCLGIPITSSVWVTMTTTPTSAPNYVCTQYSGQGPLVSFKHRTLSDLCQSDILCDSSCIVFILPNLLNTSVNK